MKKRRNNIRKFTLCTLSMVMVLGFCACGSNADETSDSNVSKDVAEQESDTAEENTEDVDQESGEETDTSVENAAVSITVTMESQDKVELTTDDGIVYYTISCAYPVVSIEGNDAAAGKINEDIRLQVDAFNAGADSDAEMAKENFEYMLSDSADDYTPAPYTSDLSFMGKRADENVISFTVTSYVDMGGAHGLPNTTAVNYDTRTGERITFDELSDDPAAFRADTLAYNQELAQTDYYSLQMFSTDDITNGTLEDVLYADDVWYLSPFGLVFMSNPYLLAPYASGVLEFTIPYDDLAGMGFNEAYAYTGRQLTKLLEDESYSRDLNGDGNDDSIVYHNGWLDSDTGDLIAQTNLTINDVDFSENGTDDAKEQFIAPSGLQFYIYDMDVSDNYLELAGVYVEWIPDSTGEVYTPTSFSRLFRYMEDGSLAYLGQVTGDVSDPTVSTEGL